jgi:hypothetical protein
MGTTALYCHFSESFGTTVFLGDVSESFIMNDSIICHLGYDDFCARNKTKMHVSCRSHRSTKDSIILEDT